MKQVHQTLMYIRQVHQTGTSDIDEAGTSDIDEAGTSDIDEAGDQTLM